MRGLVILFILITLHLYPIKAQVGTSVIRLAEEIAELSGESYALEELIESLQSIEEMKVNINSGDYEEVRRLFFLTEFQIRSLLDYTRVRGSIGSVYEISYLTGFDRELTEMMLPYITLVVDNKPEFQSRRPARSNLLINYTMKPWEEGDAVDKRRSFLRYRIATGDLTLGVTAENDFGELSIPLNKQSPDFLSGYIMVMPRKSDWRLIIGDYSIRRGQGVALNTSYRTGLNTLTHTLFQQQDQLKPYTSSGENMFFRGAAASFAREWGQITCFISRNMTDATLWYPVEGGPYSIRSFYDSGIHDDIITTGKKDAVTVSSAGIGAEVDAGNLRLGITGGVVRFSHPLLMDEWVLEQNAAPSGTAHDFLTVYFKQMVGNTLFWGEGAFDNSGDFGMAVGARMHPVKGISAIISFRRFPPGFYIYHGNPNSVYSNPSNQWGLTSMIETSLNTGTTIQAGSDLSMRFISTEVGGNLFPSIRHDIRVIHNFSSTFRLTLLYQERKKCMSINNGGPDFSTLCTDLDLISISPQISLNSNLDLSLRLVHKVNAQYNERGTILFAEAILSVPTAKLRLWGRYTLFDVNSYDTRIYVWENDLAYTFNVTMFSGAGTKAYLMAEFKPSEKLAVRVKYSSVTNELSDDVSERKGVAKVQIRLNF